MESSWKYPLVAFVFLLVLMFSVGNTVNAQPTVDGKGGGKAGDSSVDAPAGGVPGFNTLKNPLKVDSIGEALDAGLDIVTYLAVFFAVLALIWVGFKFIAARGNPQKTKEAGQWLGFIVIGLAIILGARLMVSIILGTLQATGAVNPQIINSAQNAIQGKAK